MLRSHTFDLTPRKAGEDIVRIYRVIEYVGPREWVEKTIAKSIQGKYVVVPGATITGVTLGQFPEIVSDHVEPT